MNIIKNIEIKLTEKDVKKIIAEKVNGEIPGFTVTPDDVEICLGMDPVGYLMDEHYEARFKGITVHCSEKED